MKEEKSKVEKDQSLSKEAQNMIYLEEMAARTTLMTQEILERAEEASCQRMRAWSKEKGLREWTREELLELIK